MRFVPLQSGVILTALLFLTSCENLGLDPSGKLACAQGFPKCPTGLSCLAGRCWRPGTFDGAIEDKPTQTSDAQVLDAERSIDGTASDLSAPDGNRLNGATCSSSTDCMSGHCEPTTTGAATKVCCEGACSGSCVDGCAGGSCKFKQFRMACGEIDNAYFGPRYYLCDGNGNCNPPTFHCGAGSVCPATPDVACCGDLNNNDLPACVASSACGQGAANFEQSCKATIDCPLGTFCCVMQNPDLQITACAANCQTYAPAGFDPTNYAHGQACDYLRDSSCPAGQQCGAADPSTGVSLCGP